MSWANRFDSIPRATGWPPHIFWPGSRKQVVFQPKSIGSRSSCPLMPPAYFAAKQPRGTDRSCWPFLHGQRSAPHSPRHVSRDYIYMSKTARIFPCFNNQKELSGGKKKNRLPKRSNPAFLFSSYLGKILTSWIENSKFNRWETQEKNLKVLELSSPFWADPLL